MVLHLHLGLLRQVLFVCLSVLPESVKVGLLGMKINSPPPQHGYLIDPEPLIGKNTFSLYIERELYHNSSDANGTLCVALFILTPVSPE